MASKTIKGKRSCPLFLHQSGQYAKKIHGKMRYFGNDLEKALERFEKEWPILSAGGDPRRPNAITIEDLCDDFMAAKMTARDEGRITPRHYTQLYATCRMIIQEFGHACPVIDLGPPAFTKLRARFSKGRGLHALALHLRHTLSVFKFGGKSGLIDHIVRMGPAMEIPSKKEFRIHRAKAGKRLLEAAEINAMLAIARPQVKAAIMLGINCGFGATDCAEIPAHVIDLDQGWLTYPRMKTGIVRRVPLWKETVKALREAIDARPKARDAADEELVFLTIRGKRWVRDWTTGGDNNIKGHHCDELTDEFKKLMRKAGIERTGSFYLLRHTFATKAADTGLQVAVDSIMGHVDSGIGGAYRERIDDGRLKAVTDYVRAWLFPPKRRTK